MSGLAKLRAAFKENQESKGGGFDDDLMYPFWLMEEGKTAHLRFLPDADVDNPLEFIREKVIHNLWIGGKKKVVPCMTMYGEECPICKLSAMFYNDLDDEIAGKRYWKSTSYVAQFLVEKDPIATKDWENRDGKLQYVSLNWELFNIIMAACDESDDGEPCELDDVPYDYENGTTFLLKKTPGKGKYSSYAMSKFARKPSALSKGVIKGLELNDLSKFLPKNPGLEKVQALLEQAVAESDHPDVLVGETSKPSSSGSGSGGNVSSEDAMFNEKEKESADSADAEVDDIMAEIRKRRASAAAE